MEEVQDADADMIRACRDGDENSALELMVQCPALFKDDVLEFASGLGLRRVVQAFIDDANFKGTNAWTVAFIRAGRIGRADIMRDLIMNSRVRTKLLEESAYTEALMYGYHDMFNVLVEHGKYACPAAFAFVLHYKPDIMLFDLLLDKPRVDMTLGYLCRLCRVGQAEALRRILAAPWLDTSRAALAHLVHVAEKGTYSREVHVYRPEVIHVLKQHPNYSDDYWPEENVCNHTKAFRRDACSPRVVSVLWCMNQVPVLRDIVEPTIDRMRQQVQVILQTDAEGPLFGIPGAPATPPDFEDRFALVVLSLVCMIVTWFLPRHPALGPWNDAIGRVGCFCLASVLLWTTVYPRMRKR